MQMAQLARLQRSWDHTPPDTCFRAGANVSTYWSPGSPGSPGEGPAKS